MINQFKITQHDRTQIEKALYQIAKFKSEINKLCDNLEQLIRDQINLKINKNVDNVVHSELQDFLLGVFNDRMPFERIPNIVKDVVIVQNNNLTRKNSRNNINFYNLHSKMDVLFVYNKNSLNHIMSSIESCRQNKQTVQNLDRCLKYTSLDPRNSMRYYPGNIYVDHLLATQDVIFKGIYHSQLMKNNKEVIFDSQKDEHLLIVKIHEGYNIDECLFEESYLLNHAQLLPLVKDGLYPLQFERSFLLKKGFIYTISLQTKSQEVYFNVHKVKGASGPVKFITKDNNQLYFTTTHGYIMQQNANYSSFAGLIIETQT